MLLKVISTFVIGSVLHYLQIINRTSCRKRLIFSNSFCCLMWCLIFCASHSFTLFEILEYINLTSETTQESLQSSIHKRHIFMFVNLCLSGIPSLTRYQILVICNNFIQDFAIFKQVLFLHDKHILLLELSGLRLKTYRANILYPSSVS